MENYAYDIELYPDVFTATFLDLHKSNNKAVDDYMAAKATRDESLIADALSKLSYKRFVIGLGHNDKFALRDFIALGLTLYGFNNHSYDDVVLMQLLRNLDLDTDELLRLLYTTGDTIINDSYIGYNHELYPLKVNKNFVSIDLKLLHHLQKGLKMVAIAMKYPFIEDLPIRPGHSVGIGRLEGLLFYNLNDVLMTRLMLLLKLEELTSRQDAVHMYNTNRDKTLSASRPELAKLIIAEYILKLNHNDKAFMFKKTFRKYIPFDEIIIHFNFEIPEFKDFYENMKLVKFRPGTDIFKETFIYNGVTYNFGIGGLHTKDIPQVFEISDKYEYIDIDADSYYPWLIINHGFEPKHLRGLFLPIFRLITETRITAKKAGKAKLDKADIDYLEKQVNKLKNGKLAAILKIVINSSFGQLNDVYSFLLDPKQFYATTINGQLGLLYVAEKIILSGCEILSVNTDGIIAKVPRERKEAYERDSIQAFLDFKATSEFTYYKKYVRTSVNSYLTIKTDGTVKLKGQFEFNKLVLHDGYAKGFDMPVVAYALVQYYTKGISVSKTLRAHRDIYDFCKSSNIGSQYSLQYTRVVNGKVIRVDVQKHVRYYISVKGGVLLKVNLTGARDSKLAAGYNATIFNDYHDVDDFKEYDINYAYYIKECNKLIDDIERRSTKSIKKYGGTLFD